MKRLLALPAICAGALLFSGAAVSAVIKIGDTVYVDGKEYTWAEWKKLRDHPELQKQTSPVSQGASTPALVPATAVRGARAASCTTPVYYDEFPKESDEFECTAGLGSLTREQLLDQGWKVDFVEKLPPPAGQPTTSPRGLPLSLYKLVISR